MTAQDVAKLEGVDVTTVRAWIRDGKLEACRLPSGKHNSVLRIDLEQYQRFLDSNRRTGPGRKAKHDRTAAVRTE